jgi:hypothetical protein
MLKKTKTNQTIVMQIPGRIRAAWNIVDAKQLRGEARRPFTGAGVLIRCGGVQGAGLSEAEQEMRQEGEAADLWNKKKIPERILLITLGLLCPVTHALCPLSRSLHLEWSERFHFSIRFQIVRWDSIQVKWVSKLNLFSIFGIVEWFTFWAPHSNVDTLTLKLHCRINFQYHLVLFSPFVFAIEEQLHCSGRYWQDLLHHSLGIDVFPFLRGLAKRSETVLPYVCRFLLPRFQKQPVVIIWYFHLLPTSIWARASPPAAPIAALITFWRPPSKMNSRHTS